MAAAAAGLRLSAPAGIMAAAKTQSFSLCPSSLHPVIKLSCFQTTLRSFLPPPVFSLAFPRRLLFPSLSAAASVLEAYRENHEEDPFGAEEPQAEWKRERSPRSSSTEVGRLYVGNLPFSITSSELAEVFNQAGTVDTVEVVCDRVTNRSRGFGFVTMASAKEANEAIRMFDGVQVGGRTLKVNSPEVSRGGERELSRGGERELSRGGERQLSRGGEREVMGERLRSGSRGNRESPYKIHAGNLGWTVTSETLMDVFSKCSGFLDAKVVYERDSGRSRGFGFINFASAEDCQDALQAMDGQMVSGRPIRLNLPSERAPSRTGQFGGSRADW